MARDTAQVETASGEPFRRIPGLKKPARTWQDEVRERVVRRKRDREAMLAVTPALEQQAELSHEEVEAAVAALDDFAGLEPHPTPNETHFEPPSAPVVGPTPEPAVQASGEESSGRDADLEALDQLVGSVRIDSQGPPYDALGDGEESRSGGNEPHDDELSGLDQLSFRTPIRPPRSPSPEPGSEPRPAPEHHEEPPPPSEAPEDELPLEAESPTWSFDLEPLRQHATPVERPAFALERAEAVAVDLLVLGAISGVVAYFAARVAQVPLVGLLPGVSYFVAFLVGIGLLYATCFTGATGQTPGKMLVGLRVVDTHGSPPGAARALSRSVLALLGLACLGLGAVPIFLDPARRAAHDRIVGTRVIRP